MKKQNRNLTVKIRLTEEELEAWKEKSLAFGSLSSMLRMAVETFDYNGKRNKIEILDEFSELLRSYENQFSHVTGNLNQVVKRVNQLAKAGSLDKSFFEKELYSQIIITNKNILSIKKIQKSIYTQLLNMG